MAKKKRKQGQVAASLPTSTNSVEAGGPLHEVSKLSADISSRTLIVCAVIIVIAAWFLRSYHIELRPFHNDEAVNHYFLQQLRAKGYFPYSHENYHGPSYFYLTQFFTLIFGDSEFGIRFSAILMGVGIVTLPLMLLKTESRLFVVLTMVLAALSSSLIFYSRYAIHESLFLFASMLVGFSVYLWQRTYVARYLYLGSIGLGLLIATKETFIIALFCIFMSALSLGNFRRSIAQLWTQRDQLSLALCVAILIIVVTFTGGFQWPGGLREMFLAVPQWISRNESDTGHFKPFWYYGVVALGGELIHLIPRSLTKHPHLVEVKGTEPYLVFGVLLPLSYLLFLGRRTLSDLSNDSGAFARFSAVWAVSAFLVYAYVDYKTPWLIVNIVLPAILVLAWWTAKLWSYPEYGKMMCGIVCAGVIALSSKSMLRYNFEIPYGKDNPFSYVHTHQGMMELVDDIHSYRTKSPTSRVVVGVQQYWPLPYYLRDIAEHLGYLVTSDANSQSSSYDILILDSSVTWDKPGWTKKYYRLSDVQESNTYFKQQPEIPKN